MILQERGLLGRVDPRVKLVWVLATLIAGLLLVEPVGLAAALASIALVAGVGGVLRGVVQRMRGLGTLIVVIGLILGLTVPGEPLASLGPLIVSREGLMLGLISILRMLIFAAPVAIVVMTTNNSDLIQGFMAFRLPQDYALMIVLALNFVPLYLEEFGRIADAQKARAHSLIEQGIIGKLRGLVPIFIPLTLNAVDRADTIGRVLEIRGVARRRFRAEFEPLTRGSWALLGASVLVIVASVAAWAR